ncbi:MAG: hypothetical protein HY318_06760, partial [Armatimonadetes bacterium]|nr:hypothetical protein [Armatimonadota bacterium]
MSLEQAVRAVHDFDSLLTLLREQLRWPLPDDAALEDATFEWSANELRVHGAHATRLQHGTVKQLRPVQENQPWGIFLVQFTDGHVYRTALRQVLRGLVPSRRRDSSLPAWKHDNLLFVCATADYQQFSFAHFRGEKVSTARLATFGWKQGDRYVRTLCEHNLPALEWPEDEGADAEAWTRTWAKAFDKEPLTREFFKRFDKALELIQSDLLTVQRLASAEAYSRAQLLLERLLFLYFL